MQDNVSSARRVERGVLRSAIGFAGLSLGQSGMQGAYATLRYARQLDRSG